jgi:AcrR family transcriptional regulator
MSWSKHDGGRGGPRGYHHGNLKEALLRAALELIAKNGPGGFTFAEAARWAGVSPAAPYRHFRDRDELLASVALRGFQQFEAALTRAWDDGRPNPFAAFDRLGKAYLAFARSEPAYYSAMFEAGIPLDTSPARHRRAHRYHAGVAAAAGWHDGAARVVAFARHRVTVCAWRCRPAQVADVGRGAAGSGSSCLSARARCRRIIQILVG